MLKQLLSNRYSRTVPGAMYARNTFQNTFVTLFKCRKPRAFGGSLPVCCLYEGTTISVTVKTPRGAINVEEWNSSKHTWDSHWSRIT
jgi:hypothetical protein